MGDPKKLQKFYDYLKSKGKVKGGFDKFQSHLEDPRNREKFVGWLMEKNADLVKGLDGVEKFNQHFGYTQPEEQAPETQPEEQAPETQPETRQVQKTGEAQVGDQTYPTIKADLTDTTYELPEGFSGPTLPEEGQEPIPLGDQQQQDQLPPVGRQPRGGIDAQDEEYLAGRGETGAVPADAYRKPEGGAIGPYVKTSPTQDDVVASPIYEMVNDGVSNVEGMESWVKGQKEAPKGAKTAGSDMRVREAQQAREDMEGRAAQVEAAMQGDYTNVPDPIKIYDHYSEKYEGDANRAYSATKNYMTMQASILAKQEAAMADEINQGIGLILPPELYSDGGTPLGAYRYIKKAMASVAEGGKDVAEYAEFLETVRGVFPNIDELVQQIDEAGGLEALELRRAMNDIGFEYKKFTKPEGDISTELVRMQSEIDKQGFIEEEREAYEDWWLDDAPDWMKSSTRVVLSSFAGMIDRMTSSFADKTMSPDELEGDLAEQYANAKTDRERSMIMVRAAGMKQADRSKFLASKAIPSRLQGGFVEDRVEVFTPFGNLYAVIGPDGEVERFRDADGNYVLSQKLYDMGMAEFNKIDPDLLESRKYKDFSMGRGTAMSTQVLMDMMPAIGLAALTTSLTGGLGLPTAAVRTASLFGSGAGTFITVYGDFYEQGLRKNPETANYYALTQAFGTALIEQLGGLEAGAGRRLAGAKARKEAQELIRREVNKYADEVAEKALKPSAMEVLQRVYRAVKKGGSQGTIEWIEEIIDQRKERGLNLAFQSQVRPESLNEELNTMLSVYFTTPVVGAIGGGNTNASRNHVSRMIYESLKMNSETFDETLKSSLEARLQRMRENGMEEDIARVQSAFSDLQAAVRNTREEKARYDSQIPESRKRTSQYEELQQLMAAKASRGVGMFRVDTDLDKMVELGSEILGIQRQINELVKKLTQKDTLPPAEKQEIQRGVVTDEGYMINDEGKWVDKNGQEPSPEVEEQLNQKYDTDGLRMQTEEGGESGTDTETAEDTAIENQKEITDEKQDEEGLEEGQDQEDQEVVQEQKEEVADQPGIEARTQEKLEKPYKTFNDGSGKMVTVTTETTEKDGIRKTTFKTQTTNRKGEPRTQNDKGYNSFEEAVENLDIDLESEKNETALELVDALKESRGKETLPARVLEIRESTDESSPFFGMRTATVRVGTEKIDFRLKSADQPASQTGQATGQATASTQETELETTTEGRKPLTMEEISQIQDPEVRKAAEIEFIMSNLFAGVGEAAANKIREYADRILSGKATREDTIKGLPKSFVDGIDALLSAEGFEQAPSTTEQVEEEPASQAGQVTGQATAQVEETIDDDVFKDFIDNNSVPDDVIESIADKIVNNQPLSKRETAIQQSKGQEIEDILQQRKEGSTSEAEEAVTQEEPVSEVTEYDQALQDLKDKASKLFGDDVSGIAGQDGWEQSKRTKEFLDSAMNFGKVWIRDKAKPTFDQFVKDLGETLTNLPKTVQKELKKVYDRLTKPPLSETESIKKLEDIRVGEPEQLDNNLNIPVIDADGNKSSLEVPAGTSVVKLNEGGKKSKDGYIGETVELEEDGEGNFVFYHYGKAQDVIDPAYFKQNSFTTDERDVPISFFYTRQNDKEKFFEGQSPKIVKVPKERVYDVTADPLNLRKAATESWLERFPFPPRPDWAVGQATEMAKALGFDMVVYNWPGGPVPFRAETSTPMKVDKDAQPGTPYKATGKFDQEVSLADLSQAPGTIIQSGDKIYQNGSEFTISSGIDTGPINKAVEEMKSTPKESDNGATFNSDGTRYDGGGILVPLDSVNVPLKDLSTEGMQQFMEEHAAKSEAGDVKFGFYKFEGRNEASMDLNLRVDKENVENAKKIAAYLGQNSLFDIGTFEVIPVGRTGQNPKTLTDQQFIEIVEALENNTLPDWVEVDGIEAGMEALEAKKAEVLRNNPMLIENLNKIASDNKYPSYAEFHRDILARLKEYEGQLKEIYGESFELGVENAAMKQYMIDQLSVEAIAAYHSNTDAQGWYDQKLGEAISVMAMLHPELAVSQEARTTFNLALAITSNGNKVDKNFELAEYQYEYFKNNGRFDLDKKHGAQNSGIKASFDLINRALDYGVTMKELDTVFSAQFQARDLKFEVDGKEKSIGMIPADHTVYGAAILGKKVGNGFYMNLQGEFNQLTVDRWLMRTFGRLTGNLRKDQPEKDKERKDRVNEAKKAVMRDKDAATIVRKALAQAKKEYPKSDVFRQGGFTSMNLDQLSEAIQKASVNNSIRDLLSSNKLTDELRRASNTYQNGMYAEILSPTRRAQIPYYEQVFAGIQNKVRESFGMDIDIADLQAMLWYPEKALYETTKKNSGIEETLDEGFQEEGAPDYSNAAQKLAKTKGLEDGKIREAVERGKLGLSVVDGRSDGSSSASTSEIGKAWQRLKDAFRGFMNLGFAFDPKQEAEKQKEFYDALVNYARVWLKTAVQPTLEKFRDAVVKNLGVDTKRFPNQSYDITRAYNGVVLEKYHFEELKAPSRRKKGRLVRLTQMTGIDPEARRQIAHEALKDYVPQTQQELKDFADAVVEELGSDLAESYVNNSTEIGADKRVAIGVRLAQMYNQKASTESNPLKRMAWINKVVMMVASLQAQAREYGRAIDAFKLLNELNEDNLMLYFSNSKNRVKEKLLKEYQKVIDAVINGQKAAKQYAIDKTASEAKKAVEESKATRKSADYSKRVKKNRKSAEDRFKNILNNRFGGKLGIIPDQPKSIKEMFQDDMELAKAAAEYGYWTMLDGVREKGKWILAVSRGLGINKTDAQKLWHNGLGESGKTFAEMTDPAELSKIIRENLGTPRLAEAIEKLGYNPERAQEIATALENRMKELYAKKVPSEIKRRQFKRIPKAVEDLINQTHDLDAALNESQLKEALADALGVKEVTQDQLDELRDLVRRRDQFPEESRLRLQANQDVLAKMGDYSGAKAVKGVWGRGKDLILPIWYASILSGKNTQQVNISGNILNGFIHSFILGINETIARKDPYAMIHLFKGFLNSFGRASNEFQTSFRTGVSMKKGTKWKDVRGALEEYKLDPENMIKDGLKNPRRGYLAQLKYVGRFMASTDNAFYVLGSESYKYLKAVEYVKSIDPKLKGKELKHAALEHLYGEVGAYENAYEAASAQLAGIKGIKERDVVARAYEILDQNLEARDAELAAGAHNWSEAITYNFRPRGVLGAFAQSIDYMSTLLPPIRFMVPFTTIVTNVLNQQIDFTPIGFFRAYNKTPTAALVNKFAQKDLRHVQSKEERDLMLGKATIGTLVLLALGALHKASEDEEDSWFVIHGGGPPSWRDKQQLMTTQWRPYTLEIGGSYWNYQWTPFGFGLGLLGNYLDQLKYNEEGLKDRTDFQAVEAAVMEIVPMVLEMSTLTGLSDLFSTFQKKPGKKQTTSENLVKRAAKTAGGFIPRLFKDMEELMLLAFTGKSSVYEPKDLDDYFIKEVPFLRTTLDKRKNWLDQEINVKAFKPFGVPYSDVLVSLLGVGRIAKPKDESDPVVNFLSDNDLLGRLDNTGDPKLEGESMKEVDREKYDTYFSLTQRGIYNYIKNNMSDLKPMSKQDKVASINKAARRIRKFAKLGINSEDESDLKLYREMINEMDIMYPPETVD